AGRKPGAAGEREYAAVESVDSGDRPRELCAPRAEQASETENLPLVQLNARVGEARSNRDVVCRDDDARRFRVRVDGFARADLRGVTTEHLLHEIDPQQLPRQVLPDEHAVSKHGDAVADLVDL